MSRSPTASRASTSCRSSASSTIAAQAASALAAAHDKDVVHRDIKPENLFILKRNGKDFVKVVDFGISKSLRTSDTGDEEEAPRLTQTGMVLGTPLYMSPEQARGDDSLDHRVDIYALGVIMYEASTGRVPFAGNNYLSVISQVLNEQPRPPRELRPELSEEFENLVLRSMAKDRADRYQSAKELLEDLTGLIDDPTRSTERAKITGPRRRPKRDGARVLMWITGIAVTVAAITITVVQMMSSDSNDKERPAAAIDAGTVAVTAVADAAPPPPDAAATITLHVETDPPGARIARDGEDVCTAPCALDIVDRDRDVEVKATLDGYDDATAKINPLEHHSDARKPIHIKLKKTAPQAAARSMARCSRSPYRRARGTGQGAGQRWRSSRGARRGSCRVICRRWVVDRGISSSAVRP